MDLYANKKIKITKNTITGEDLLTLTNKHSYKNNGFNLGDSKKYYSTKSFEKDDKYLSYIRGQGQPQGSGATPGVRGNPN
jgi:hypothetical protein